MSNYKPLYEGTDSAVYEAYHSNKAHATKLFLNSMYGTLGQGENYMNREYISVIVDEKPTVIFKRNIIAVTKDNSFTDILCVNDYHFLTKEDYASVVKKIIG